MTEHHFAPYTNMHQYDFYYLSSTDVEIQKGKNSFPGSSHTSNVSFRISGSVGAEQYNSPLSSPPVSRGAYLPSTGTGHLTTLWRFLFERSAFPSAFCFVDLTSERLERYNEEPQDLEPTPPQKMSSERQYAPPSEEAISALGTHCQHALSAWRIAHQSFRTDQ